MHIYNNDKDNTIDNSIDNNRNDSKLLLLIILAIITMFLLICALTIMPCIRDALYIGRDMYLYMYNECIRDTLVIHRIELGEIRGQHPRAEIVYIYIYIYV